MNYDDLERDYPEAMEEIRNKNSQLWRFVRTVFHWASGDLDKYLDIALKEAEYRVEKERKRCIL